MRVFYRCVRRALSVYEETSVAFCCPSMALQWGRLLGFGVRGSPASTSREVNLFVDRQQANKRTILEVFPIQYCPFCGEAVETVRVKR